MASVPFCLTAGSPRNATEGVPYRIEFAERLKRRSGDPAHAVGGLLVGPRRGGELPRGPQVGGLCRPLGGARRPAGNVEPAPPMSYPCGIESPRGLPHRGDRLAEPGWGPAWRGNRERAGTSGCRGVFRRLTSPARSPNHTRSGIHADSTGCVDGRSCGCAPSAVLRLGVCGDEAAALSGRARESGRVLLRWRPVAGAGRRRDCHASDGPSRAGAVPEVLAGWEVDRLHGAVRRRRAGVRGVGARRCPQAAHLLPGPRPAGSSLGI